MSLPQHGPRPPGATNRASDRQQAAGEASRVSTSSTNRACALSIHSLSPRAQSRFITLDIIDIIIAIV
jgi:hypothetical protein